MRTRARKRPLISANFAVTWGGRISTRNRTPSDFSSPEDKRRFLALRAEADAILVTVRTAEADRMSMGMPSARLREQRIERGQAPYPLRVLITNSGKIPASLAVFSHPVARSIVYTGRAPGERMAKALVGLAELRVSKAPPVDLSAMATELWKRDGVRRLHCEGGGELFRSLVAQGLMDEIHLTLCPRIFGSAKAPTLTGALGDFLPKSTVCRLEKMEQVGGECFVKYQVESR